MDKVFQALTAELVAVFIRATDGDASRSDLAEERSYVNGILTALDAIEDAGLLKNAEMLDYRKLCKFAVRLYNMLNDAWAQTFVTDKQTA